MISPGVPPSQSPLDVPPTRWVTAGPCLVAYSVSSVVYDNSVYPWSTPRFPVYLRRLPHHVVCIPRGVHSAGGGHILPCARLEALTSACSCKYCVAKQQTLFNPPRYKGQTLECCILVYVSWCVRAHVRVESGPQSANFRSRVQFLFLKPSAQTQNIQPVSTDETQMDNTAAKME